MRSQPIKFASRVNGMIYLCRGLLIVLGILIFLFTCFLSRLLNTVFLKSLTYIMCD